MAIGLVRAYILTDRERKILERFIEAGEKLNGFSVLDHYLRKSWDQLRGDMDLIEKAMEKGGL